MQILKIVEHVHIKDHLFFLRILILLSNPVLNCPLGRIRILFLMVGPESSLSREFDPDPGFQ